MDILLSIRSKSDSSTREIKSTIAEGLVIGRGVEKGVLLEGQDLSREHFVITADGADLFVTDLSSNGTWVNGARLNRSERTKVRERDLIEIPGYAITFKLAEQAAEKPAPQAVAGPSPHLEPEPNLVAPPAAKPGPLGMVFQAIGAFTMLEKISILLGVAGLSLLYAYFGS